MFAGLIFIDSLTLGFVCIINVAFILMFKVHQFSMYDSFMWELDRYFRMSFYCIPEVVFTSHFLTIVVEDFHILYTVVVM